MSHTDSRVDTVKPVEISLVFFHGAELRCFFLSAESRGLHNFRHTLWLPVNILDRMHKSVATAGSQSSSDLQRAFELAIHGLGRGNLHQSKQAKNENENEPFLHCFQFGTLPSKLPAAYQCSDTDRSIYQICCTLSVSQCEPILRSGLPR